MRLCKTCQTNTTKHNDIPVNSNNFFNDTRVQHSVLFGISIPYFSEKLPKLVLNQYLQLQYTVNAKVINLSFQEAHVKEINEI